MYAADFETAIKEQQASLEMNPDFGQAIKGLALAQFAPGRRDAALATWKKLEATDASAAAEGPRRHRALRRAARGRTALLEKAVLADVAAKDAKTPPPASC